MTQLTRKIKLSLTNKFKATNLSSLLGNTKLIVRQVCLCKQQISIHLKTRSSIFNQHARLTNCSSKNEIK